MLTTLRIKNLALVADLTLELEPGFNVITGETGAGKSILIGALNLVLGERADRNSIRGGNDSCSVEAVFDIGKLKLPVSAFLEANGLEPCEAGQLLLKRVFTAAGANRQFVNGSPTSLSTLATLGEWLVDIHGPHEHQSLLNPARQLTILDAFGGLEKQCQAFSELVRRRAALLSDKAALIIDEKTYAQQLDLLRFQVSEIGAARLQPEEEEEVEREYRRASNAARLIELSQSALELLAENDASLISQAGQIGRTLQDLQRLDPGAGNLLALQEQAVADLQGLRDELSHYADRLELDPARLHQLEQRLDLLHSLKVKYGASLAEVIAFGDQARLRLEGLEQRDAVLSRLQAELTRLDSDILRAGHDLSVRRRELIPQLCKAVSRQLADLGFRQSRLDIVLTNHIHNSDPGAAGAGGEPLAGMTHKGFDTVEFQFAPNPGELARPLRAIASSGELARVMLALKTVLAAEDEVPVLVFDEVDANVGGETGGAVGQKMRQIARQRQVICITHLPQVAAPASTHFVVAKQSKGGRTVSEMTRVEQEDRVDELARMLGGQTDSARKHARSMLGSKT